MYLCLLLILINLRATSPFVQIGLIVLDFSEALFHVKGLNSFSLGEVHCSPGPKSYDQKTNSYTNTY